MIFKSLLFTLHYLLHLDSLRPVEGHEVTDTFQILRPPLSCGFIYERIDFDYPNKYLTTVSATSESAKQGKA